jgi:molybdate transport system regulatory protein
MDMKTKLYLVDNQGEKFMGIGVLWLLKRIDSAGSLRAAAATLGISYSKAYTMVSNLEQKIGVPVVNRKRGGADHEGSSLTAFGERFIALYDGFQEDAKRRLVEPFEVFSKNLEKLLQDYTQDEEERAHE